MWSLKNCMKKEVLIHGTKNKYTKKDEGIHGMKNNCMKKVVTKRLFLTALQTMADLVSQLHSDEVILKWRRWLRLRHTATLFVIGCR